MNTQLQPLPTNTFRPKPVAETRTASPSHATRRTAFVVKPGQIFKGPHNGYWRVDHVQIDTVILEPVFKDGTSRPAMRPWVKNIHALDSPFWILYREPLSFWQRNLNRVVWSGIMLMGLGVLAGIVWMCAR